MAYKALFDPSKTPGQQRVVGFTPPSGDASRTVDYVYDDRINLAVNVALATGRPLLLRGNPGTGKSSLAADVAKRLGWRYYPFEVTTRTESTDLLYRFDTVRRFNDANANQLRDIQEYIEPKALWWAFSPDTARWRGFGPGEATELPDPASDASEHAVVLIDEIDKADPDVPNSLLVALGSREFEVPEISRRFSAETAPLLMITTNDERALPEAFLRRCVNLTLPDPKRERLEDIARAHFGDGLAAGLLADALDHWEALKQRAESLEIRPPGIAECLDLLWACKHLEIQDHTDSRWKELSQATLWKHEEPGVMRGARRADDDEL